MLIGIVPLARYILDYSQLTSYGKGFIWGKILIIVVGLFLILVSFKLKKPR